MLLMKSKKILSLQLDRQRHKMRTGQNVVLKDLRHYAKQKQQHTVDERAGRWTDALKNKDTKIWLPYIRLTPSRR